jgi:ADP-ribosylglycohydrolase
MLLPSAVRDERHGNGAAVGSLLGLAVGDALGLPYEGLAPGRAAKLLGAPSRYHLLLGRGMVSDDTDHACFTAAALVVCPTDVGLFTKELARQLRWWILGVPAGVGLATAQAAIKLWLGWPSSMSGVRSAGNGPAMRAPILGACVMDLDRLDRFVIASSKLTHTDERAIDGARIVALAANLAARAGMVDLKSLEAELTMRALPADPSFAAMIARAFDSVARSESTMQFAAQAMPKRGVSGFIVHTVPVALHACMCHPNDLVGAVQACVGCGGDTDTTAAIAGGIIGAAVGPAGIPEAWLANLWAAPRSVKWMRMVANAASTASAEERALIVPRHAWSLLILRNVLLLALVVFHGFRRLLPPYRA